MAFEAEENTHPAYAGLSAPRVPNIIGTVQKVHIDEKDPLNSYAIIKADPKDNLNIHDGIYKVSLDASYTHEERLAFQSTAAQKGSGYTGAMMNKAFEKRFEGEGVKLELEGARNLGDGRLVGSWITAHDKEASLKRRPGILRTEIEKRKNEHGKEEAYACRVTGAIIINPNVADLTDKDRVNHLCTTADRLRDNCAIPSNTQDSQGRKVIRESMFHTAVSLMALDKDTNEVLEYSRFFEYPSLQNIEYPESFSKADRQSYNGKPYRLPYSGEQLRGLFKQFEAHIKKTYPDRNVIPAAVEGFVVVGSPMAKNNKDMYALIEKEGRNGKPPVVRTAEANGTVFASDINDNPGKRSGAYHPDLRCSGSKNSGSTFSQYANIRSGYIPDAMLDKPWVCHVAFNKQPVNVPDSMMKPIANPMKRRNQKPASDTPQQGRPAQPTKADQPTVVNINPVDIAPDVDNTPPEPSVKKSEAPAQPTPSSASPSATSATNSYAAAKDPDVGNDAKAEVPVEKAPENSAGNSEAPQGTNEQAAQEKKSRVSARGGAIPPGMKAEANSPDGDGKKLRVSARGGAVPPHMKDDGLKPKPPEETISKPESSATATPAPRDDKIVVPQTNDDNDFEFDFDDIGKILGDGLEMPVFKGDGNKKAPKPEENESDTPKEPGDTPKPSTPTLNF